MIETKKIEIEIQPGWEQPEWIAEKRASDLVGALVVDTITDCHATPTGWCGTLASTGEKIDVCGERIPPLLPEWGWIDEPRPKGAARPEPRRIFLLRYRSTQQRKTPKNQAL